jgi:hypothetical protein
MRELIDGMINWRRAKTEEMPEWSAGTLWEKKSVKYDKNAKMMIVKEEGTKQSLVISGGRDQPRPVEVKVGFAASWSVSGNAELLIDLVQRAHPVSPYS